MKYAAAVLFNNRNPLSAVDYPAVTDALLAGGVFLDEIAFLPYDAPSEVVASLGRLSAERDGLFVICDKVLVPSAKEGVARAAGEEFTEEYLLEREDCLFAVLPAGERGAELVRTETVPRVDRRRGRRYSRVVIGAVGAPEQLIHAALASASEIAQGKLTLHATEEYACTRIEILYDDTTPKMISDEVVQTVASTLGEFVYTVGDETVAERLFECLKLHRVVLSTAESFTGGGVGGAIVAVPGASAVFREGINAYAGEAKAERLGVKEETLREKGAVSDETAYQMAAGLIRGGKCDLAIATTGVAGPDPDGEKPVGLCYIAVGTRERVRVWRYHLTGDRETITKTAVNLALFKGLQTIR